MDETAGQDALYAQAIAGFGPALARMARAYEANDEQRRDLIQDIHVALWRSFSAFDGRCSLRTWTYRVAHNVGAAHALKDRRAGPKVSLEALNAIAAEENPEAAVSEARMLAQLMRVIQSLGPPDRQILLLYLEDLDAAAIGEVTGLSAPAVATRIHRVKAMLTRRFNPGDTP